MGRINGKQPKEFVGAVLLSRWCNIFGDDNPKRVLGGLADINRERRGWYCPTRSVGRFRMVCEHGHQGQIMDLCARHVTEFGHGKVTFCPRCNAEPPGHKCELKMVEVS